MAESAETGVKGPNPYCLLIILNRFVALFCLGAAVVVYVGNDRLNLPGLAAAPYYEPIIVHCLLTALALFAAATQLARNERPDLVALSVRFVGLILFPVLGFINLMLAVRVGVVFGFNNPLTYVLGAAGLLLGWMLPVLLVRKSDRLGDRMGEPSGYGPVATLGVHLWMAFLHSFAYISNFFTLLLAIPYFRRLDLVFLERRFDGWFDIAGAFSDRIKALLPEFAVLFIFIFSLTVIAGLIAAAEEWRDGRRPSQD